MQGMTAMPRRRLNAAWVGMGCGVALTGFSAGWLANAREPEPRVATLVSSGQTVAGETIAYPEGAPAQVTAVILTLQPGEKTGLHTHGVPTFGYVLEGELTVSYEGQGNRIYKAGDGVLEAMRIPHDGRNTGAGTMRILAVFMGAEGVALSVPAKNSRLE
ncbi:MAG: cupin domain-containing protein [Hyphomicrobium sp.]